MNSLARLCFSCLALSAVPLPADTPLMEVRQAVIRAPELEVIELVTTAHRTDAEVSAQLWQWVKEGRASVVSDINTAVDDLAAFTISVGHRVWIPTMCDQDMDRLWLQPTGYEETLVGTSIECGPMALRSLFSDGRLSAVWKTRFSPREPLMVKWPVSWLEQAKSPHGWMDWRDLFEESFGIQLCFTGTAPTLMAMLPPADQVWPGERQGRWLDVFEARLNTADHRPLDEPESKPRDDPSASNRTTLIGISVDAREALDLSLQRDPAHDDALLQHLLDAVKSGSAHLRFSSGAAPRSGDLIKTASGREHRYPTEMPSIPSAWESKTVGTRMEMDYYDRSLFLALDQDLTPPGQTTWPLALDDPSLIMHEPQFRRLRFNTDAELRLNGARLLGLLHVPDCMDGNGLSSKETILVFARHDEFPVTDAKPSDQPVDRVPCYEAEIIVFEVPAKEEAQWQPASDGQQLEPDAARFMALAQRVKAGTATIAAHVAVLTRSGKRANARVNEEVMSAVEFDPPRPGALKRIRPTGLIELSAGSMWNVEVTPVSESKVPTPPLRLRVSHVFTHSTHMPIEPTLKATLNAYNKHGNQDDMPKAKVFDESWKGDHTLMPGEPLCLGTRTPLDPAHQGVRHVAFIRVREAR